MRRSNANFLLGGAANGASHMVHAEPEELTKEVAIYMKM